MNFFSHFHFFEGANAQYNTGLVLPDFVKGSTGARIKFNQPAVPAEFADLQAGCHMHVQSDKWFHGSQFFGQTETMLKAMPEWEKFASVYHRAWFVAHIMIELTLDRVLMRSYSGSLHEFYYNLRRVDEKVLHDFMQWQEVQDIPRFFNFLHRFREAEYLFEYLYNDKFIFSLGQICRRTGLAPFGPQQADILHIMVPLADKLVTENLPGLMHEISDFRVKLDNLAADAGV